MDFCTSIFNIQNLLPQTIYSNSSVVTVTIGYHRYYDHKRFAVSKHQKTIDASSKALKSAEKKTKQALKVASKMATIKKARKVYWFEKFYWFISSENYLVIGGRDQQQNELIVKKYLNDGDLYVHADLHGASSIVIKNPSKELVPSRTLSEAATMATCYSTAWEAKITSTVWWVWHHQVSKTAPSGEYLTTGSFMIRGKKNYLPASQLMLCFGFMFKLDEDSVSNHYGDRRVKTEDDPVSMANEATDVAMEIVAMESDGSSSDNDTENQSSNVSMVTFPDTIIGLTGSHDYSVSGREERHKGQLDTKDEKKVDRKVPNKEVTSNKQQQQGAMKRGQKYKQKKMKERYKDQDDEDRLLRMQLLASAGDMQSQRPSAGKNKKKNDKRGRRKEDKYCKVKQTSSDLVEVTNKQQDPVLVASLSSDHVMSSEVSLVDHMTSEEVNVFTEQDHVTSEQHHVLSEQDHVTLTPDNVTSDVYLVEQDHVTSEQDHVISGQQDHGTSEQDHVTSGQQDHGTSEQDHVTSGQDDVISQDHMTSCNDHMTTKQEHDTGDHEVSVQHASVDHFNDPGSDHNDQNDDQDSDQEENEKDDISSLLDTLTGCPSNNDILLFAVPVCAPYMAMTQYKYKVKIIPGIQRRGKAARTALHNFIHGKEVTPHEKDLLLSVKDNDLSRYFPGKVKMLATNSSASTKYKHK